MMEPWLGPCRSLAKAKWLKVMLVAGLWLKPTVWERMPWW